jgi:hypothetical protein
MTRFIVWQLVHEPTSIVGTIEAESQRAAIDMARATWGSFRVVEWSAALPGERAAAAYRDGQADAASE